MLAMTSSFPPQRAQVSISIANSFGVHARRLTVTYFTRVILTPQFDPGKTRRHVRVFAMTDLLQKPCTVFDGPRRLSSGPLSAVALVFKKALEKQLKGPVLLFDDTSGRTFDIDIRGSNDEVIARLAHAAPSTEAEARGPGRPKLGVVAREVTLLPRHWDWLAAQPGGASVTLRKLVDAARRDDSSRARDRARCGLSVHPRDGRRQTGVRGGDTGFFRRRSRAVHIFDRGLARRCARARADACFHAAQGCRLMHAHLEPTQEAGRALFLRSIAGPVVMLNLLRFRKVADYSSAPHLAPVAPISGAAAFQRYIDHALPHLHASGGDVAFLGEGGAWLIGPTDERWDLATLVRQHSVAAFLAFASNEAYLAGMGHRTAAVEDSRLLPLAPISA